MAKKRKKDRLSLLLVILLIFILAGFWGMLKAYHIQDADEIQPASATVPVEQEAEKEMTFDRNDEYLILVNKTHTLDKDYVPADLVEAEPFLSDRAAELKSMRPKAAEAFKELTDAAAKEGYTIKGTSGYRSYAYQKMLRNYYLTSKGEEWTEKYSAKAGASEHQTGLAADVSCASLNYQLQTSFGETAEGKWLASHAHEYGFIIRYQEGKEDITGYAYEPWHIRYVGKDAAKVIYEQGLTLEEFIEQI